MYYTFSKAFLDSAIHDITVNPYRYPRGKNFAGEFSEFRKYQYDMMEIVHLRSQNYKFSNDTIIIHEFSFSGRQMQWNEDDCFHFLYNVEWGIIGRGYFDMAAPFDYSYIKTNSCFTEDKNRKLQKLTLVIRNEYK